MTQPFRTIDRSELEKALASSEPDNEERRRGFALVNVLDPDAFRRERIPGSINIPSDHLGEFDRLFRKEKPIIVYCASPDCAASHEAAAALARRGFDHVFEYEGGLRDWKDGGNPVEGRAAA